MPASGPVPKDNPRFRAPDALGWTDVPDGPFAGPSANLPAGLDWLPQVAAWWAVVRRMPHCVLWSEADWLFAVDTAYMKQDWWLDYAASKVQTTKSTEIRRREDQLGVTLDARRKLRIRYVTAEPVEQSGAPAGVTSLDPRRQRRRASGT